MADLSKTIQIVFDSIDNTGGAFKTVGDGIDGMSQKIGSATQPMSDLAGSILTLTTGVGALGAAMTVWAVNEAGKFSDATNEINTLVGLSPGLMEDFRDAIIDYAKDSTQSIDKINLAVYDAISAGVDYKDALDVVRVAEQLAVAGKADLGDALNLLVPTLNAYGAEMDKAGGYSDIFFTAVRLGKTTIPELATELGRLAPTAASVGVPIGTVAAALATLTSNGAATNEAATGIKAALSNIIKPSSDAAQAAKDLGVEFGVSALQTKGLEGLLKDLILATDGNISKMALFFGSTEALNTVLSLSTGEGKKFKDAIDAMASSTGATTIAYDTMANNFGLINQRLENNMRAVLIKVGDEVLPEWGDAARALSNVFSGVADGVDDGAFNPILDLLRQFARDAVGIFEGIAENLPDALELIDWTGLENSLRGLVGAIGSLFVGVDLDTPEGLADAIQSVVNAGDALIRTASGIVTGMKPFIDAAVDAAQKYVDAGSGVQGFAGKILGIGTGINAVLPAVGLLGQGVSSLGDGLSLLAGASLAKTIAGLSGSGGLASAAGTAAAAFGKAGAQAGLVGAAGAAGYAVGTVLSDGIDKAIQVISGDSNQSLGGAIYDGVQAFKAFVTGVDPVKDAMASTALSARALADDIPKASTGFRDLKPLIEQITDPSGKLKTEFEGLGTEAADLLTSTMDLSNEIDKTVKAQILPALGLGVKGVKEEAELAAPKVWELDEATGVYSLTAYGMSTVTGKAKDAVSAQGDAMQDAADKTAIMNRASVEFMVEWEKIQSAERVAIFEASADIKVAQIEADSRRTVVAFESMRDMFVSTGQVLTDLFGIWAGLDSSFDREKVEDWIKREYEIREKLADGQIKLLDAEIKRMEAQTALLDRGGVEVKISSDGLEPALEAFMFTVVDRVRTQIAGSYEDFLLGCGS